VKQISVHPFAARLLQNYATEQRSSLDDLAKVVRVVPKFRRGLKPHLKQLDAMLAGMPAEAFDQAYDDLAAEPVVLKFEDADFEFVKGRFLAPGLTFPDPWAEKVLALKDALENPVDPEAEGSVNG
jgi:hypothetical protein